MGYIFILYTTFRFNIQGYPFRYHFFTSSAYFKCQERRLDTLLFASPRTTLHQQRSWLKSKEESLSLPTPSCQALLSTCLPIPSALSQTAHTSSLPNWTERSPPIELCIDTYIGLYVTLSGKTLSRI